MPVCIRNIDTVGTAEQKCENISVLLSVADIYIVVTRCHMLVSECKQQMAEKTMCVRKREKKSLALHDAENGAKKSRSGVTIARSDDRIR